jgi:hypothetical protein
MEGRNAIPGQGEQIFFHRKSRNRLEAWGRRTTLAFFDVI